MKRANISICGLYSDITEFDKENTYALFGTKDTLVHGYDEFMLYYKKALWFEGEHRLNLEVMRSSVIPLIGVSPTFCTKVTLR